MPHFSDELFKQVCEHLADGKSLRQIAAIEGMPSPTSVVNWLNGDKTGELIAQYTRARELQAEKYAEEIVSISDEKEVEAVYCGDEITLKLDSAAVNRNRLRVEARKWVASKLLPKKYGDKVAIGGDPENPVQHSVTVVFK